MKTLKRIRYYTMNSWNLSTAPAYNLKVYNVIDNDLHNKVFELMECEFFYEDINNLIHDFNLTNDYQWQAGFNGRSGGYLVLYKGGWRKSDYKSVCTACGQRNFTSVKDTGTKCGKCGKNRRIDKTLKDTFTYTGKEVNDNEVPPEILKAFRKLAVDIVKDTEWKAKNCKVQEETYTIEKTRKVLISK